MGSVAPREDFVPRASRPCSGMAGTPIYRGRLAMAQLWLRVRRAVLMRFFETRDDFVPRASRPCSGMAGTPIYRGRLAMAQLWLRLRRAVLLRFFETREDFVPWASCPSPGMAGTAMALWLRVRRGALRTCRARGRDGTSNQNKRGAEFAL